MMKKLFACITMMVIALTAIFAAPAEKVQAAEKLTTKTMIGTWKSADGTYTLGLFSKGVLKIQSKEDKKWVSGTWKLDADKKTVTLTEDKYLKDNVTFKYTKKKLTSEEDSKFYFKKSSSKTPSTSTVTKKSITGTWQSADKSYNMILMANGDVYMKSNNIPEFPDYEKVNEIGTWKLNASKKTVVIPDYVFGMGEATWKYTKNKLTNVVTDSSYTKISNKTDLE